MKDNKKVLIFTYYWPPSGGSGVQRWTFFAKYLKALGWEPIVITVDEKQAAYPVLDLGLLKETRDIEVVRTNTKEPLRIYSRILTGSSKKGIPQGSVPKRGWFSKTAAFIRGNFFFPDARIGWNPYAITVAKKYIQQEGIQKIITTGPPHSTHLLGLQLKTQFGIQWWADFRDPWTDIFYNKDLYRSSWAQKKDARMEWKVLHNANGIFTTVGGSLVRKLQSKAPDQKFHVLPNGFDEALLSSVPKTKNDIFHVVYTGLLTDNQDYLSPIELLNSLAGQLPIGLSLAGNISAEIIDKIKEAAPKIQIDYKGYLSHVDAIALIKSGDLLLNFIFRGAGQDMISGKLLEYLASEVPVLSVGDPNSEAGRLLDQASFAKMIDAQNTTAQKSFIKKAIQQKGKAINIMPDIQKWTRENITKSLSNVLEGK